MEKYEFTGETRQIGSLTLNRIRYIIDIPSVGISAGDLGGWIEKESNLSHDGNACVFDNALVFDNARVCGDALVFDNALVCGDAWVYGDACVYGDARVYGNACVSGNAKINEMADYIIFKNFWSSGRYFTWTRSNNMWRVGCFYGSGEELIKKSYKYSQRTGREYERVVRYVESILNDEAKESEQCQK